MLLALPLCWACRARLAPGSSASTSDDNATVAAFPTDTSTDTPPAKPEHAAELYPLLQKWKKGRNSQLLGEIAPFLRGRSKAEVRGFLGPPLEITDGGYGGEAWLCLRPHDTPSHPPSWPDDAYQSVEFDKEGNAVGVLCDMAL